MGIPNIVKMGYLEVYTHLLPPNRKEERKIEKNWCRCSGCNANLPPPTFKDEYWDMRAKCTPTPHSEKNILG